MANNIKYDTFIQEVTHQLGHGGLFLNTKAGDTVNTMVIGWGGITIFWGKPIFIAPVRQSRYTHELLEKSSEFSVSVPLKPDENMKKTLAFCGSKSGRDMDKFRKCNITPVGGRSIDVPIIGECPLHYECKIIYKTDIVPNTLDKTIDDKWYPDYHTLYFGEILNCYTI